jgi:hypothetical protein
MAAPLGPTFFPPLGPATTQPQIDPQGWDRCVLGGQVVPAHCRITHGACGLKKDPKSKSGADGSNPTYRGMDPKPISMEITTYNDPDREALASLLGPYIPVPGVQPKPVSIDHPSLRMIRVFAVVIEEPSALIPEPGTTKAKMTLLMQHWLPSRQGSATATPKGAPVRKPKNIRKKPSQDNPPPTKQKGFASPPANLGNGQ